jgi:hypothetical protein
MLLVSWLIWKERKKQQDLSEVSVRNWHHISYSGAWSGGVGQGRFLMPGGGVPYLVAKFVCHVIPNLKLQ